ARGRPAPRERPTESPRARFRTQRVVSSWSACREPRPAPRGSSLLYTPRGIRRHPGDLTPAVPLGTGPCPGGTVRTAVVVAVLAMSGLASAEEGMWTFDRFPSAKVKAKYGFAPNAKWLEHVRLASVRTKECSAGFVSASGLLVTNHHCASDCAEDLSTSGRDLVKDGFLAQRQEDELRCPGEHVDQLVEITDVTGRIGTATRGKTGDALASVLRAETGAIEKACQVDARTRCQGQFVSRRPLPSLSLPAVDRRAAGVPP